MSDLTKEYVSVVNDVIEICKDAEKGFHGAADAVKDPTLKSLFEEYSTQRAQFASELQSAVRRMGGNPETPSGVAGKLHSGWMAVKGAFTGHSEHEILEETERGEDLSLKTYREALSKEMPETLRSIVEKQYQEIQQAHKRIRTLRDTTQK
jgi:uncharacterized protein (TIGR02284 family)